MGVGGHRPQWLRRTAHLPAHKRSWSWLWIVLHDNANPGVKSAGSEKVLQNYQFNLHEFLIAHWNESEHELVGWHSAVQPLLCPHEPLYGTYTVWFEQSLWSVHMDHPVAMQMTSCGNWTVFEHYLWYIIWSISPGYITGEIRWRYASQRMGCSMSSEQLNVDGERC